VRRPSVSEQPNRPRTASTAPGVHDHVAGAHVVADPPRPRCPSSHHRVDSSHEIGRRRASVLLDHHDGVGARRNRRPGHDARSPGPGPQGPSRAARPCPMMVTTSMHRGPSTSAERTAYPSSAEFAHGGDRLGDTRRRRRPSPGLRERHLDGRLGGAPGPARVRARRPAGSRLQTTTGRPERPIATADRAPVTQSGQRCPRGGRPRQELSGTPDRGPLAPAPAPPSLAGSRSSCRCRSGRLRTSTP
jgi:hypothetical protein